MYADNQMPPTIGTKASRNHQQLWVVACSRLLTLADSDGTSIAIANNPVKTPNTGRFAHHTRKAMDKSQND